MRWPQSMLLPTVEDIEREERKQAAADVACMEREDAATMGPLASSRGMPIFLPERRSRPAGSFGNTPAEVELMHVGPTALAGPGGVGWRKRKDGPRPGPLNWMRMGHGGDGEHRIKRRARATWMEQLGAAQDDRNLRNPLTVGIATRRGRGFDNARAGAGAIAAGTGGGKMPLHAHPKRVIGFDHSLMPTWGGVNPLLAGSGGARQEVDGGKGVMDAVHTRALGGRVNGATRGALGGGEGWRAPWQTLRASGGNKDGLRAPGFGKGGDDEPRCRRVQFAERPVTSLVARTGGLGGGANARPSSGRRDTGSNLKRAGLLAGSDGRSRGAPLRLSAHTTNNARPTGAGFVQRLKPASHHQTLPGSRQHDMRRFGDQDARGGGIGSRLAGLVSGPGAAQTRWDPKRPKRTHNPEHFRSQVFGEQTGVPTALVSSNATAAFGRRVVGNRGAPLRSREPSMRTALGLSEDLAVSCR